MNPIISVIIPAFNEEKLLPRCLQALRDQTYPKDKFEVILIDNNSGDKTSQIGRKFGARVLLYNTVQRPSAARRFGTDQAKGAILAYTDADSIVAPDWLATIEKSMEDPEVMCVGGRAIPDDRKVWNSVLYLFYDYFQFVNHVFGKPIMWGFNMAVRKKAYDAVGGMDPHILSAEDWDMALRIKDRFGRKSINYIRSMKVSSSARKQRDLKIFWRYTKNGFSNYFTFIILGKRKVRSGFDIR